MNIHTLHEEEQNDGNTQNNNKGNNHIYII